MTPSSKGLKLVNTADIKRHISSLNSLNQNKHYLEKIAERDRIETGVFPDLIALSKENIELQKQIDRIRRGQVSVDELPKSGAPVSSTGSAQVNEMS